MQGFGKKAKSFMAAFLAVLYILPPQFAAAGKETATAKDDKDSAVHWGADLPANIGDMKYDTDKNWYRLVLEYGPYCTNSTDSAGNYSTLVTDKTTSWPAKAWHDTKVGVVVNGEGDEYEKQPEDWLGKNTFDHVTNMTAIRDEDAYLYRYGNYSMTGLNSLYIKYAGLAKDGVTPCYYISPCDKDGNREKKLWALDCCLDVAADDNHDDLFTDRFYQIICGTKDWPGQKPVADGIAPTFSLLTPTFEEFENKDNFRYAGLALSYYYDDIDNHWDCENELGHLYADYTDNHKWIFIQNEDGSWQLKSAGYIDWDWSDEDGDLATIFGNRVLEFLHIGIGTYIKACCYAQVPNQKSRDDDGLEYGIIERYYIAPWIGTQTRSMSSKPSVQMTPMLWLNEYAENVYILAGHSLSGTEGGFRNGFHFEDIGNKIDTGCGAYWTNSYTSTEYDAWMDKDIKNGWKAGDFPYYNYYCNTSDDFGKTIVLTNEDGTAKTVEEIKAQLKIGLEFWAPTNKALGAWDAMYIGTPLATETYNASNTPAAISAGVTEILGVDDKNLDGCCDGAAFIGSIDKTGCRITVEEGATLQIDGPTYVASGTTLQIDGTVIISPGAFLCVEDSPGTQNLWIEINGTGKLVISNGAMLDTGMGEGCIKLNGGGTLINSGICVIGSDSNAANSFYSVFMNGGSIENGPTGWFIAGASVRGRMRTAMLKGAAASSSFESIVWYLDHMYDHGLGLYDAANDDDAYKTADFRMCRATEENVFRNEGNAFIAGSFKAEKDSDSHNLGSGKLYRGWDIYADSSLTFEHSSFANHQAICAASGSSAYEDETLKKYYSMTNIESGVIYQDTDAETECLKNNVLALRLGTGTTGTDRIASFKITYVDKDGKERAETVSPASVEASYEFVRDCEYCGKAGNEKGDSDLSVHGGWMEVFSAQSFATTLEPYTNNTYFFQSLYPLDYVKSITVVGTGTGSWSCTELNLYRVKYLYPIKEYGWSSWSWYAPFSGTLLAEVPLSENTELGVKGSTFVWDSENIVFGAGTYALNVYEVPSGVSSESDPTTGFCYYNASTDTVEYSTHEEDYLFSLSLADAEGAGIEEYYIVDSDTSFDEFFSTAEIQKLTADTYILMKMMYIDTNGSIRTASMNFTLSAAEWGFYCLDATERLEKLHGLFQQGEDIIFAGVLPDFRKLYSVTLDYKDAAGAVIGVSAFSLSKPDNIYSTMANVTVQDGMLKADNSGTAISFYCADDLRGTYVNAGQTMTVPLKDWNGTEKLKPSQKGSRYLVVVKTDEMSDAATMRDINVYFAYKTLADTPATTGIYNLRTAVNDYYGYWLSADGSDADCAYKSAVSSGGEMRFVVDIENLYEFTSATFSIDADGSAAGGETSYDTTGRDEWQMSSIAIYDLTSLGERKVELGEGVSTASITTNRTYYRDNTYGVRGAINSGKGPLMVGPGQSKTITFEEGGGTVITGGEGTSENKLTDVEELSYWDTKQDFGLNTKRARYLITVQVDGASITSVEDGDCGSKNQFYFQLVFMDKNGKQRTSPLVLSNQQLRSDGFRTGTAEEFSIYTNDDYGTPIQINIIPDDTSSTSDVFDKLCIDYITVSKSSGTGVSLNWVAKDVGWIDIEYKDDGGEQTGRSDAELIRSFELEDAGYNVWIEFGIQTYTEYMDGGQFEGQVLADITYRDASGAIKTKSNVAVVGAIASYAERMSELGTTAKDGTEVSVPSYMFRKGYTNRFLVQFDDISALVNMKLKITPTDDTAWAVSQVFARQVFDEGTLSLNKLNEYEHYYSETPQDLASSVNASAVKIDPNGGSASATFVFSSGNSIKIDTDDDDPTVIVKPGESEGKNDYITMTAELEDITGIDFASTMTAKVIYKNIYGDICEVNATLVFDNDTKKFMIPENLLPTTANIGMPYQVELTSGSLSGRVLKSVNVSHLRAGQVLNEVNFKAGENAKLAADAPLVIAVPDSAVDEYAKEKGYTTETQKLFAELGSLTQTTLLSESGDLRFALIWTKKGDPYHLARESDYVSALESGYSVLESGSTLCIPFSVEDVESIVGIRVKTSDGTMRINVNKACISVEETSDLTGKAIFSGWVNLPAATTLISGEGTTMDSDGLSLTEALASSTRITPVRISMKTANSSSDAVAKVTLCYTDTANLTQSISCQMKADDWNYLDKWLLTSGLKTPLYYTMEALDSSASGAASFTVSSVELSWYDSAGQSGSSKVGTAFTLTKDTPVSTSLITTSLTGTVTSADGTKSATLESNLVKENRTDYSKLTFTGSGTVNITASLPAIPGELEINCVNTATNETIFTANADSAATALSYSFDIPANTGSTALNYCITVSSKSMPHQYAAKVYIEVQPALYIEGFAYRPDGSLIAGFTSTDSTAYSDLINEGALNPGDVLRVYARVMNSTGTALAYTTDPADGTAFTVAETQGATVTGNAGLFTEYLLTVGTTENQLFATFKLYSAADPNVSYTLTFMTASTPSAPTPEQEQENIPEQQTEPEQEAEQESEPEQEQQDQGEA